MLLIVTSYTVDALDRTTLVLYPNGGRVSSTFDSAGQMLTLASSIGITTYSYDLAGRLISAAYPAVKTLTYSYDQSGNRLTMRDPYSGITTYAYDAGSRLSQIVNPFAETTTFLYDALDREAGKVLANGMTVSHSYDAAGREVFLANRSAAGVDLANFTLTYDGVGNCLSMGELSNTLTTYTYDVSGQLLSEWRVGVTPYNTAYTYDGVGNRLSKLSGSTLTNSTYNALNQLTLSVNPATGASTSYSYDAVGNLSAEVTGSARTTYAWDEENRLVSLIPATGSRETTSYAADGKRHKKVTSSIRYYLWDEENLFGETDGNLNSVARYTDYPGYWGGLSSQRQGAVSGFYGFDPMGNTHVMVSSAGLITDTYWERAFGDYQTSSLSTANFFRFGGKFGYYREATTRFYVRNRIYDPVTGRWRSPDPLGFDGGDFNLYRYVGNNPVNWVDPFGLKFPDPRDIWEGGGGGRVFPHPGRGFPPSPGGPPGIVIPDWMDDTFRDPHGCSKRACLIAVAAARVAAFAACMVACKNSSGSIKIPRIPIPIPNRFLCGAKCNAIATAISAASALACRCCPNP